MRGKHHRSRGQLIAFSGLDGAGKSTQIQLLLDHLQQSGKEPIYLWTRAGYTPLFEALKALLRRLPGRVIPPRGPSPERERTLRSGRVRRVWLTLALLDLIWVYGLVIRWYLLRGRVVVCDRYLWDSLIDFRLNFPADHVEESLLWRLLARVTPQPDAAFLLLIPVQESKRRSDIKGEPFPDSQAVLAQRLDQYRALAIDRHWYVLDGCSGRDELFREILEVLAQRGAADDRRIPR